MVLGKSKNKSGVKVKAVGGEGAKKKTKRAAGISEQKVRAHPLKDSNKKRAKKSENAARKAPSSSVSGKAADIASPLVLNYWNGRGLMEVPRLMLGEKNCANRFVLSQTFLQRLLENFPVTALTPMRATPALPPAISLTRTLGASL